MNIEHLFLIYFLTGVPGLFAFYKFSHFDCGRIVHEGSCVDGYILAVFNICARLTTTLQALVLEVVNHETAIVHDFRQPTSVKDRICLGVVYALLLGRVFNVVCNVDAVTLGKNHSQDWPPSFAAAIHQIIYRGQDALIHAFYLNILEIPQ